MCLKNNKSSKELLFERMNKVAGMPLREENYSDYLDTHYSADGMDDYSADKATQSKAEQLYDKGFDLFNAGDIDGAEKLRQEVLRISSGLGWDENELPPYGGLNEENSGNPQLPPELSNSEEANIIMGKINELLDLLNDPDIDQSEGGVSDKMREMALHMINANR